MTKSTGLRRSKGSGSVTEVRPGVWRVRVFAGVDPITRTPRQVERTVRGGRRQAEAKQRQLADEVAAGIYGEKRGTSRTVGDLLRAWPDHLERVGKAPATLETYRAVIRKHLIPVLGTIELRKLTPFDIDGYYERKGSEGLSAATVRQHGLILSGALTQARKWGWIIANPCESATLPQRVASSRHAPGVEDVRKLIEAAGDDIDLATAVMLGALTGCRRGELLGLQWHDLDRASGTLLVERARLGITGGDVTGPPKGKKPRRVAVGQLGVAMLDRYAEVQEERARRLTISRKAAGAPGPHGDRGDWLLSHDCGYSPISAKWLSRNVTALGKRAGVPVVTHELRHFAATQLVAGGVDVTTAAHRLGHAPEMLLRVYAHAMPSRDVAAAAMLEASVLGALPAADSATIPGQA